MTALPKDTEKFMKEYLWPLYNRVRRPLKDHPSFDSEDWLAVCCIWCILGDALSLNPHVALSNIGSARSVYHPLLQGAEELDWLLCLQPNT